MCSWTEESGSPAIIRSSEQGPVQTPAALSGGILQLLQACKSTRECPLPTGNGTPELGQAARLMVIPILAARANASGALLLGEKKSEELYTETDRHLLDGVAHSIGVAFENLWLKKRVDEGLRERQEVLGRLDRQTLKLLKECPECGACFDSLEEVYGRPRRTYPFFACGAHYCTTIPLGSPHWQGRHGGGL